MVRKCENGDLDACVEMAFRQNGLPENYCAYCPESKEKIYGDFKYIINGSEGFMAGYFSEGALAGILGFYVNPESKWADCLGPFFSGAWNMDAAKELFLFAKAMLPNAVRFNFYFGSQNINCRELMKELQVKRNDNEYLLRLDKEDYKPQEIKVRVVKYSDKYKDELLKMHGDIFPGIYVTGSEIIASVGRTREAFCALDEKGDFAGYGVLKLLEGGMSLTAEIFAVKKELRGKGYGWALLNKAVEAAFGDFGGSTIYLVVDKLNTHARDLYFSCGFRLVAENESYCLRKK